MAASSTGNDGTGFDPFRLDWTDLWSGGFFDTFSIRSWRMCRSRWIDRIQPRILENFTRLLTITWQRGTPPEDSASGFCDSRIHWRITDTFGASSIIAAININVAFCTIDRSSANGQLHSISNVIVALPPMCRLHGQYFQQKIKWMDTFNPPPSTPCGQLSSISHPILGSIGLRILEMLGGFLLKLLWRPSDSASGIGRGRGGRIWWFDSFQMFGIPVQLMQSSITDELPIKWTASWFSLNGARLNRHILGAPLLNEQDGGGGGGGGGGGRVRLN